MSPDVLLRVREMLPQLSASERRVAEAVLADPRVVRESTITELAGTSASAASTVARFCQRLGFDGYRQFRAAVIAARPQERRQMLEEAAGIAGLHVRRRDAEQKLRATEANLAKLDEVIAEQDGDPSDRTDWIVMIDKTPHGVGLSYDDFTQVDDDEVIAALQ